MKYVATLLIWLLTAGQAGAWGANGHSIVGELAQRRLTPAAVEQLRLILGGNISLASIGSWADDYKFTAAGSKTKPWHFINLNVAKAGYSAVDCPIESCLPKALDEQISILTNAQLPPAVRRTALYFLVHLAGDWVQPFHCTDNNDAGGNGIKVDYRGLGPDGKPRLNPQTNLHAVWDEALVDNHAWSWGSYAEELEATVIPAISPPKFSANAVIQWTDDCHRVGIEVYKLVPAADANGIVIVTPDYQTKVQDIVARQLALGGLQLAAILNAALAGQ